MDAIIDKTLKKVIKENCENEGLTDRLKGAVSGFKKGDNILRGQQNAYDFQKGENSIMDRQLSAIRYYLSNAMRAIRQGADPSNLIQKAYSISTMDSTEFKREQF